MANQTVQDLDTQPGQQVEGKVLENAPLDIQPTEMFAQEPASSKVLPRILLSGLAIGVIVAAPKIWGFLNRVYVLVVGTH